MPPGEPFPGERHAHTVQAELLVILDGTVTVDTVETTVTVSSGDVIRFDRGEFHALANARSEWVIGIGIRQETTALTVPRPCPGCGHPERQMTQSATTAHLRCPTCNHNHQSATNPDGTSDSLVFEIDRSRRKPRVVCRHYARHDATPPVLE